MLIPGIFTVSNQMRKKGWSEGNKQYFNAVVLQSTKVKNLGVFRNGAAVS
jgi:hypothetical protein